MPFGQRRFSTSKLGPAGLRRWFFLASPLLLCASAFGQPSTRSVSGVVTDPDGNPVKGAVVQIENSMLLNVRSYITQDDGRYHFSGLHWEVDYRLKAEYHGAEGSAKRLSEFDPKAAKVINLEVPLKTTARSTAGSENHR